MRLYVDDKICEGYGICVKEYPEIFRFMEGSKKAKVMDSATDGLPQNDLIKIANICPVSAIKRAE